MAIDITKLSSKELFELAKKREQEEQQAAQQAEKLAEARKKLAQLIARHEEALVASDKAIRELQEKRTHMVKEFEAALAPIELDIQELERQVKQRQQQADSAEQETSEEELRSHYEEQAGDELPEPIAPPTAPTEPAPSQEADNSAELIEKIRAIMRNRTYISESLLKEKLKAGGFDMASLKKEIDKLIREGKLERKGGSNYALGKKR